MNYRAGLINFLRSKGFRVFAVAPLDDYSERVAAFVDGFFPVRLSRKGINPFAEAKSLLEIFGLLRRIKPDAVLAFTPKPNIYSGMACRVLDIPGIHNVAGLGSAFRARSLVQLFAKLGYRGAFRKAGWVFFQNERDKNLFLVEGICSSERSSRLLGSGIDCERFSYVSPPAGDGFAFLMCSRLLKTKGVNLYVQAAQALREKYPNCIFMLLGSVDVGNPDSLTDGEIEELKAKGVIQVCGFVDDVRPYIERAHCIVHPSTYMEGLPRILLEGGAIGRPAITTDWPGCRDAVTVGKTGALIEPHKLDQLVAAMELFLNMDRPTYLGYCLNARRETEARFAEALIHHAYAAAIDSCTP